jgi:hypothetical protein
MDILEFFDVNNIDHLKAFDFLSKQSHWPTGFIPKDVTFDKSMGWHLLLESRMADKWIEYKLSKTAKKITYQKATSEPDLKRVKDNYIPIEDNNELTKFWDGLDKHLGRE